MDKVLFQTHKETHVQDKQLDSKGYHYYQVS